MMINYQLVDAKLRQEEYVNLFKQYCEELLLEDTIRDFIHIYLYEKKRK